MKMITAIVQPFMLDKITDAFEGMENFPGMTVVEARGFGRKLSFQEQRTLHHDPFHPKARIEIVAPNEMVESIVSTLVAHAHTGNHGDGKVFVWHVETAVRVQTGERDEAAL